MDKIKVYVVAFGDRRTYQLQWTDPHTGRRRTRSTKIVNDGRQKSRKEAERAAADLESALATNYSATTKAITWEAFRDRYEREKGTSLAVRTQEKIAGVFNSVEEKINPSKLSQMTEERISAFAALLRDDKLSESTIKSMLAHLKAALRWAAKMKLIGHAPEIELPGRATERAKGRPISGEEFDRMIAAVSKVIRKQEDVHAWERLLRGLWLSGLRLGEALKLFWDRDDRIRVDFSGKRPILRIPAAMEKGNKERQLPITPDFAELLLSIPENERRGRVFPLPSRIKGQIMGAIQVGRWIGKFGEKAGVIVSHDDSQPGDEKFASAHDLRRSFAARWVTRVTPQVLMVMMRHESIQTTLRYYAGLNAERTADAIWEAFANKPANTPQETTKATPEEAAKTSEKPDDLQEAPSGFEPEYTDLQSAA